MREGNSDFIEPDSVQDLESLAHIDKVSGIMEVEEPTAEFGRLKKVYQRLLIEA